MTDSLSQNYIRQLLQDAEKDENVLAAPKAPTGACTITVLGLPDTCTAPMTEKSCAAVAKKVGGTYDWKEGEKCSDT